MWQCFIRIMLPWGIWGQGKKEGLFSKESQRPLHIPSQHRRILASRVAGLWQCTHFMWMQGHSHSCQTKSHPLSACAVTGKVLPMGIFPTSNRMGSSGPMAHGDMETPCMGRAQHWAFHNKLFIPALKSQNVFWRANLTSSAMQLPVGTCSPTRKVTPTYWSGDGIFTLSDCEFLTCLVTLPSLSMTICPSIIPSESAPIAACFIKWMNPCVS